MAEPHDRGNVVVYGSDVRLPPILDTNEAQMIVIKDGFGDPMIVIVRVLSEDTWGMVTKADPDWNSMLVRYGIVPPPKNVTLKDMLTEAQ